MAIDLFEQAGIKFDPVNKESTNAPRDLLAEAEAEKTQGVDLLANAPTVNVTPGVESSTETVSSSPFMTGVMAFNNTVEKYTLGLAQAATKLLNEGDDTRANKAIVDYMSIKQAELEGHKKINPTAAVVGSVLAGAGLLATTLALPVTGTVAGSVASGAGVGAATGLLKYNEDKNVMSDVTSGAVGGAIGGAVAPLLIRGVKAIATTLSNTVKGVQIATKNPEDLIGTIVTDPKITMTKPLDEAIGQYTHLKDTLKGMKDKLYQSVDDIATATGAKVGRENLTKALSELKDLSTNLQTPSIRQALATGKGYVGNNTPLTFKQAQDVMKSIGSEANAAFRAGKTDLMMHFNQLKTAMLKDIDTASLAHPELAQAQSIANTFYKSQYKPVSDVAGKINLVDASGNQTFLNSVLHSNIGSQLPKDVQKGLLSAHLTALKESKTTAGGEFNAIAFAKSLQQSLNQSPFLKTFGQDVSNIAKIYEAKGVADKAFKLSPFSIAGSMLANPYAAVEVVRRSAFLASAGKLASDASLSPLLKTLRNSPSEGVKNVIEGKISNALSAFMAAQLATSQKFVEADKSVSLGGVRG